MRLRATGEVVQVGVFPYGVFGTPRDLLGVEELLVGFYTRPEMVRDMMEHLTTLWISIWERVAGEVPIAHIHVWEDMSGKQGPLISPKMVRSFMMPCYDRIAAVARSAGVRIISVDTDGDCCQLVPLMMEHGIAVFLPFEVQAGNDVLVYRRRYPERGPSAVWTSAPWRERVRISTMRCTVRSRWCVRGATSPGSTISSRPTCLGRTTATPRRSWRKYATEVHKGRLLPAALPPRCVRANLLAGNDWRTVRFMHKVR